MYNPPNLGTHVFTNKPVKQRFSNSKYEKDGIIERRGITISYNRDDYMQTYEGELTWNNMHGYGEYQWQSPKYKHEGQFYANKKEGYGRISYPSGAYFEGLYRRDERFGPGIYTDPAGLQDVGIWVASKLIRLSRVFEPDYIMPRLAITDEDKIQILRYREIINLQKEKSEYLAENLLENLIRFRNYDKSVLARADELYNRFCRDDRAPLFNKPKYDEAFFGHEYEFTIDVVMTEEEEMQQKIATESRKTINEKSLSSDNDLRFEESTITDEILNLPENLKGEKEISEILYSQSEVSMENEKEEELKDYCGIKKVDLENTNDTFFLRNHEEQWNIFQSSAIMILQNSEKNSKVNSLNKESFPSSNKTVISKEFDDFGKPNINNLHPTKKVIVTDLMAWNNSPILIEILKHVFKHRNFEKRLSFDISKILAGKRSSFREEGTYEKAALELLTACSNGCQNVIPKLISRGKVDVDVTDSRGNTGLLFAAAGDRIEVIDILLNLGANVDSINDECLTPLAFCILRLLAVIHSVTNWSKAFLPKILTPESEINDKNTVFKNLELWHGRVSYESLLLERRSDIQNNNKTADTTEKQKYILDLSPIIRIPNSLRNVKNKNNKVEKKSKERKASKNKELLRNFKHQIQDINDSKVITKKEKIFATISKLLERGADPNFGQVPYPSLIMAIFSKMPTLVSQLLQYGADPNTTLSKVDHFFTPLLILAVLQPAAEHAMIAKALLKAKGNPNVRADPEYRSDLMERLNRNRSSKLVNNFEGITPLHLLAIRPDIDADSNNYSGELIKVICQEKYIRKSDLYYGHSPLSLAIFEGNLTAVKAFLKTTCININEQLGEDLGNVMFMLESRLLQKLLHPDFIQECLELLLEYGGCPFALARVLGEEFNQIEYGREELTKMLNSPDIQIVTKSKKPSKSKGFISSKPADTKSFAKSIDFIEKIGKERLIEKIKSYIVKDLMNASSMLSSSEKQLELLEEPIFKIAQTWMTAEDVAIVMKAMNYKRANVRELVRLFVTACVLPQQKTLSEIETLIRNETEIIMNKVMPLVEPHCKTNGHIGKKESKNIQRVMVRRPVSDLENNQFNVCFECLTVHGKVLIICLNCRRVYFCSQECNLKSTRREENIHRCPVYYQEEWIRLEKIAMTLGFDPISYALKMFEDPEVYTDLEKGIRLYGERQGKKIPKNEDYNKYIYTPKCMDLEKYGAEKFVVENGLEHEFRDDSAYATKRKHQDSNGLNKADDSANDIKSNKYETKHLFGDGKDPGYNIKSKNTNIRGNGLNTDRVEQNVPNNAKSKKRLQKSLRDENVTDKKTINAAKKPKEGMENRYGQTIDRVEGNDANKMESKNEKKHHVAENGGRSAKLGQDKKQALKFNEAEYDGDLKITNNSSKRKGNEKIKNDLHKNEDDEMNVDQQSRYDQRRKANHWKDKRNEIFKRLYKNEDDNIKDRRQRKYEQRHGEQERKNGTNKTREKELNAFSKKYKNNRHYVETNVPEKYLDCLLEVSRSAGEHLDIDMLLLPYVVFAQGDTYFRILPVNRYPKFAGNYSLI